MEDFMEDTMEDIAELIDSLDVIVCETCGKEVFLLCPDCDLRILMIEEEV
jgi:hypothetical protein